MDIFRRELACSRGRSRSERPECASPAGIGHFSRQRPVVPRANAKASAEKRVARGTWRFCSPQPPPADLAASAATFQDQVFRGLEALFAPALREGESAPDFTFAQELVGRLLEATSQKLLRAGQTQTGELVATAELRRQRDECVDQLRLNLRNVRYHLDRSLDPAIVRTVLRVRRVSNMKPSSLVLTAREVADTLRDPALGWEKTDPGIFEPAAALANVLEQDADALEAILGRLAPQRRTNQQELGAKLAELEAADQITRRCADFLFGLYRLAGLDFHADRLRPFRK